MSHFSDFMDGVPVKISEKYKRPPRIELPYSVIEGPIRAQNVVDSVEYCSTFERNILAKLKELKSAKETKKNERRHRVQLLGEAKQKKLDAIAAAEAEEKLKQLSVSEVSYPSTDEISALSPDDKPEKNCDICPTSTQENSPEFDKTVNVDVEYTSSSNQEAQLNILQPIQIQSTYPQSSLLDDPDPLQEYKMQTKMKKVPQYHQNVETLTYKDFENDTSSPFDNVELKTINDMELLAQVLQSQRDSTVSCEAQTFNQDQAYPGYTNCATQAQIEGVSYLPNAYAEQQIQGPSVMYSSPQHFPVSNGYYIQTETCNNTMPVENVYMPNYQYYVPAEYTGQYYNQIPNSGQTSNGTNFIPQPYYYSYPQVPPMPYMENSLNTNTVQQVVNQEEVPNVSVTSQNTVKSRSRSVPDIVKELNDEIASAKRRAHERSYNASPANVNIPRPSSSIDKREERRKKKAEKLPNPYEKLPPKLQSICQKVHSMGFALDRTARVCSLVGDNDKKVIFLLILFFSFMLSCI